ncbi:MAG TPA: hypothetical protein VHZ33_20695 [Trebonia sp.]|jgi:hypothetical protein|nr:hypothetical protein [Trebonia sp.]
MTNMYEGLGPDHTPTAPQPVAGAGGGGPIGGAGGGAARSGGRRRWTAALLLATVAAGGGAFAVAEAASSPGPAATSVSLSASSASSASSATQDAATQAATVRAALRGRGGLARLRRLGGMYGQFTDETKKGPRTVAFERGTITSVAHGDVVVRAHDGTSWVWDLTGSSVIRDDGKRVTASALAAGQPVLAGGPVTGGARDARLIVIRKAGSASA